MKITYMVTDRSQENVTNYYERLTDAKYFIERNPLTSHIITTLKGYEFGEGFHLYKLAYMIKPNGYFGFRYIERNGILTPLGIKKGYK